MVSEGVIGSEVVGRITHAGAGRAIARRNQRCSACVGALPQEALLQSRPAAQLRVWAALS